MEKQYIAVIGVDPGVTTGIAIRQWRNDGDCDLHLATVSILDAFDIVLGWSSVTANRIGVIVEDARMGYKDPRKMGRVELIKAQKKIQGVGSVKRDCMIWEDFLRRNEIDHVMVQPKKNRTKISSEMWSKIWNLEMRTNEHNRDASMLIFGINQQNVNITFRK